jgi:glycerophosphoryl diester phosphodiesterase
MPPYLKYLFIAFLLFYLYLILLFEYYYKIKRHPQDIFKKHRLFIEAHKGLNKVIFENTLEAFSKSILNNIEALETDIWVTKDKIPVLIHSNLLEGYSSSHFYNQSKNVMELTWDEILTYRTKKR